MGKQVSMGKACVSARFLAAVRPTRRAWRIVWIGLLFHALWSLACGAEDDRPGTRAHPLRVMLVPSDGGTEEGTRADFAPLFEALTRMTDLHFEIRVGQSYSSVIEAIAAGLTDLAYMGTVSFLTATDRGPVELLAISEIDGGFFYYSGLFTMVDSGIERLEDLRGKTLVFSDPSSSSGFVYPLALLLGEGIDPVHEARRVILSGSHTNSLTALAEGRADVAAAPFESYIKSVRQGAIDPRRVRIIAKSDPIPNPPIAINSELPRDVIERLREALDSVHTIPDLEPGMIRGHAGKVVDRYNADVPPELFEKARRNMALINNGYRAEILRKAADR